MFMDKSRKDLFIGYVNDKGDMGLAKLRLYVIKETKALATTLLRHQGSSLQFYGLLNEFMESFKK